MGEKSVPLSVRITSDDAEFLSRLSIDGATTPSDKLRALLARARRHDEALRDLGAAHDVARTLLERVQKMVREHEQASGETSEVVRLVIDWTAQTLAYLMASPSSNSSDESSARTHELERTLLRRVSTLVEQFIKMGLTVSRSSYDGRALVQHLSEVLELASVVARVVDQKKELI
jgi:hypothetical protein